MADAIKYKRPNETFSYTFDFTDKLSGDVDTIANGSSVTAVDSAGATVTSTVIVTGSPAPSGKTLVATLTGGTDLEDYTVTFKAKDTTGTAIYYEKVLELRVRTNISGGF